jgi:hypothetical protein
MDYRLDLFNSVSNYRANMTEEDALFIVAYNSQEGDLIMGIEGNVNLLSMVLSDMNGVEMEKNKDKIENFKETQRSVLNIALNILRENEDYRNKFKIAIDTIDSLVEE